MSVIYEPKGKAREYSPLALNLYMSCSHKCKYCYAPGCLQKPRELYFCNPEPRKNLLKNLESELSKKRPTEQVLLSFIGDVYCETQDNGLLTTEVLKQLLENKVPTAVLTKGGERCLNDLDLFKQFGEHFQIGATLTFINKGKSKEWESGAAEPEERLEVLKYLKSERIKTFASFEPVIEPEESIKLIKRTLKDNSIDVYKIGKINNYNGMDKTIDWTKFLQSCIDLLRPAGKAVYIKHDLRQVAQSIKLYGNEVLPDEHNVR